MQSVIDGLILAGGRSSRMGKDKSRMVLQDGITLIERAEKVLKRVVNGSLWISRSWDYHSAGPYDLCDDEPYSGPLSGIERAMRVSQADYLAVMAVDLPSLPLDFYSWLLSELPPQVDALLPRSNEHSQPLAGFWALALLPDLHRYRREGGRKVDQFLASHRVKWIHVPNDWLTNINTPDDWHSWIEESRPDKGL
ncbi:MAG: molybdenum cofactor guanylyltransferase [Firmicutes bacterium]|jgi:molybdopterin-guanine dinucleotide biosynthesis protein A|uniref:Probable molybdenum cofactor guanylyltransferase n=1 Tax=Sulfobacillus benefaciens TaxID=453960 RepID=A0A2T2X803_9FIRM|nr:molybdenum cofactor guanylyltransferase [Bacillota bacterium]MCL5014111.1 molybdenum cofactor guanylyltransferase [Bacillota bacterium]PSR30586.1 MAG: hypothetical protein C7B43_05775 [Sulfobacillus benefaciens]HBQ93848.1 hypothetical protein [Sulfobacillus sp.]